MKAVKISNAKLSTFSYKQDGPRIQRMWDIQATGLGVEVFPSGRKSFIFRYRIYGKQRFMTLGALNDFKQDDVNDFNMDAVRLKVAVLRAEVSKGNDPKVTAELPSQAHTLDAAYKLFIARKKFDEKSTDFHNSFKSTYKVHLKPTFGDRPIGSIKRAELIKIIDGLIDDEKYGAAKAVFTNSGILFKWAVQKYDLDYSPMFMLKPEIPKSKKVKIVLKTEDQLLKAWFFDGKPQLRALVRFLILTGARRDEIRTLRWDQIEDGILTVEDTKNERPLVLPVTPLMLEVLNEMKVMFDSEYVFPATTDLKKPIPRGSLHYLLAEHAEFQCHALRRTVKTWLSKLGVDLEGRNAVCNHSQGVMDDTYNFDYQIEPKRAALNVWHDKLKALLKPEISLVV